MSESPYAAPCVFCRYNGPNYYQAESHERHCPWWEVVGLDERAKRFRSKLVAKLEAAEKMAMAIRSLVEQCQGDDRRWGVKDCGWCRRGRRALAAWDSASEGK